MILERCKSRPLMTRCLTTSTSSGWKLGLSAGLLPNMAATSATPQKNWGCRAEPCTGEWKLMVFKNFRIQVILRIVLLTVVILTFAWCVVHGLYLRSVYLAAGIIIM